MNLQDFPARRTSWVDWIRRELSSSADLGINHPSFPFSAFPLLTGHYSTLCYIYLTRLTTTSRHLTQLRPFRPTYNNHATNPPLSTPPNNVTPHKLHQKETHPHKCRPPSPPPSRTRNSGSPPPRSNSSDGIRRSRSRPPPPPPSSHSHYAGSTAGSRGRGTARVSNASSRAASASSHAGGGGGRLMLDAGSLAVLGSHFERLMGAISSKVDSVRLHPLATFGVLQVLGLGFDDRTKR